MEGLCCPTQAAQGDVSLLEEENCRVSERNQQVLSQVVEQVQGYVQERQAKSFIDAQVRRLVEWLYERGVSTVYVGYPKNIAQQNGSFNTVQVWSYGYLLRRLVEVCEEYGIAVAFLDEAHTSSSCPIHGNGCGKRIVRGVV